MGDRSWIQMTVKAPDHLHDAIGERIGADWTIEDWRPQFEPGEFYAGGEALLGTIDEVAAILDEIMERGLEDDDEPEKSIPPFPMAYAGWQDPRYESSGALIVHVPGHERGDFECNQDGDVNLGRQQIKIMIDQAESLEGLRRTIADATAVTLKDAFEAFEITEPTCRHCGGDIRATSDVGVPWVHDDSGNSFCDVTDPADAVALAGTEGRTEAEPA